MGTVGATGAIAPGHDRHGVSGVASLDSAALADYAAICGRLLARAHARTSGASMIAGYVGSSGKLDAAMCRFARAHADQTERDHQCLVRAVAHGVLPPEPAT
jgi:hypothetical protein